MIYVLIKDGVVEHCISVDGVADLVEYYPEHLILEQSGAETIGWRFNGETFTPPEA